MEPSKEYYYSTNNVEIFWLSSIAFMISEKSSQTSPHTSWDDLSYLDSRPFKYHALGLRVIAVPKAATYP